MSDENTLPEETQERVVSKRAIAKGRKKVSKTNKVLEKLEIVYMKIAELFPNEYNPNRQSDHDFELLMRSMEEDGFTQPITANKESKIIIDGEHRWRAAGALGFKEIPVVFMDVSPEQARISTIRHNRARGTHDIDLEAGVLRDLQKLGALDWAVDSLMLDDAEVNRLLDDIAAPDALAGEEYTDAWIPSSVPDSELITDTSSIEDAMVQVGSDGAEATYAMTAEALDLTRRREKAIKGAKTEQDRRKAQKDRSIFRLALSFSGNEAEIIKEVLGDKPAVKLLEICKAQLNGRKKSKRPKPKPAPMPDKPSNG